MSLISKISRVNLDKLIEPYQTKARVLDIGAFGMPSYAKYFTNRIGMDIKPGSGVDVVGSVYSTPFSDNEFETILCLSVLEHLEHPSKAIAEMKRILKPGGKILVSVPFMFPIHDAPGDFWRFTKFGLRSLFADWDIRQLQAETNTQETIAVILQRLGYQTKLRFNKVSKFLIFLVAKILVHMPNLVKKVYSGIQKTVEEPEAFASAFFMVAYKK